VAVYTEVSDEELSAFLDTYDIGTVLSYKGIAEGVENTNYFLHTTKGSYILTLYEKRVREDDLPFFLGLMQHLALKGLNCPLPVDNRRGEALEFKKNRLGGIVSRAAHPGKPGQPLNGGPQMVEVSRDGSRIYFTNSLYTPWDEQFYPDGIRGWMAKVDVRPGGGMELDPRFFLESDGMRPHQVRLAGGDASSDSYCYA